MSWTQGVDGMNLAKKEARRRRTNTNSDELELNTASDGDEEGGKVRKKAKSRRITNENVDPASNEGNIVEQQLLVPEQIPSCSIEVVI